MGTIAVTTLAIWWYTLPMLRIHGPLRSVSLFAVSPSRFLSSISWPCARSLPPARPQPPMYIYIYLHIYIYMYIYICMYVRMYQTLLARLLSTYIRTIHGLRPPTTTRLDLSSLFVSSLAQLRLTERTRRFPPTLDGRKSTDREPRQGNLLGKTSSSTQPWTRFPSTTLPPLCYFSLFLAHSFSLPLPLPLSCPPPRFHHFPRHLFLSVALFIVSVSCPFLSPSSSPRSTSYVPSPMTLTLLLSRISSFVSCLLDLLAPEESVSLYFSLRSCDATLFTRTFASLQAFALLLRRHTDPVLSHPCHPFLCNIVFPNLCLFQRVTSAHCEIPTLSPNLSGFVLSSSLSSPLLHSSGTHRLYSCHMLRTCTLLALSLSPPLPRSSFRFFLPAYLRTILRSTVSPSNFHLFCFTRNSCYSLAVACAQNLWCVANFPPFFSRTSLLESVANARASSVLFFR